MPAAIHNNHSVPSEREEFLVDGCPRCEEYARDLGVHFDPKRFRAFWHKMVQVEWQNEGRYFSKLDQELGRKLYLVSLGLQRGFGFSPDFHEFVPIILYNGLDFSLRNPSE